MSTLVPAKRVPQNTYAGYSLAKKEKIVEYVQNEIGSTYIYRGVMQLKVLLYL